MFCKYCGAQIDDNCSTCPRCGATIDPIVVNEQRPYEENNTSFNSINSTVYGKNKLVAGLFAILLGDIGIHQFYLGNNGKGILCLLFSWTGIPAIIGLIQGILILCESDDDFAKRINLNN